MHTSMPPKKPLSINQYDRSCRLVIQMRMQQIEPIDTAKASASLEQRELQYTVGNIAATRTVIIVAISGWKIFQQTHSNRIRNTATDKAEIITPATNGVKPSSWIPAIKIE